MVRMTQWPWDHTLAPLSAQSRAVNFSAWAVQSSTACSKVTMSVGRELLTSRNRRSLHWQGAARATFIFLETWLTKQMRLTRCLLRTGLFLPISSGMKLGFQLSTNARSDWNYWRDSTPSFSEARAACIPVLNRTRAPLIVIGHVRSPAARAKWSPSHLSHVLPRPTCARSFTATRSTRTDSLSRPRLKDRQLSAMTARSTVILKPKTRQSTLRRTSSCQVAETYQSLMQILTRLLVRSLSELFKT